MRAMSFLLARQSGDGAWRDFDLPPGQSDAWVTAYVGSRVLPLLDHSTPDLARVIERALLFLETTRHKQGGWSYNVRCEPDADSTAHALLFLRAAGPTINLRDYAALARFQLAGGCFATYKTQTPQHGWGRGHPDVTSVAIRSLAGVLPPDHTILRRGYASLSRDLSRPDPWASYWWPSRLYLAREVLLLQQAQPQGLPSVPPIPQIDSLPNGFELALALDVALLTRVPSPQISRMAQRLLRLQQNDGGWRSFPILRVMDPRSCSFDDEFCRNSPVVRDDLRLFTSATALGSLIRFQRLRQRRR